MSNTDNITRLAAVKNRQQEGRLDGRPVIRIEADNLEAVVDRSEAALMASGRGLYQRGARIVSVGAVKVITADDNKVAAERIMERGDNALLEDLSTVVRFEKFDSRSNEFKITEPPMKAVKTLKERSDRLRFPVLTGIINAPTLRRDGSILDVPGYDSETGLLFNPGNMRIWPIAGSPTRNDAEGALNHLKNLIGTFPFVGEADRSVALAALMTAVVRHSLPTAPLFGFSAPVAGSGKSMLVDIVSAVATGREAGVIAQGKTDEEMEKRLGAQLLAGDAVLAIDNCESALGGDLLCQILTQSTVRIRILGKSETVELPTGALVTATGNALTLVGDMTRRALLCNLDPRVERPELRIFNTRPVEDAKANRGIYVCAILTVLRAYIAAGKPRQANPLGSFERWSDLVRGALIWLGSADPVSTMESARMGDPITIARRTAMAQWRRAVGYPAVTVGSVIKIAEKDSDLHDALILIAGVSDKISSVRLGKWLGRNKDVIVTIKHSNDAPLVECCFREGGISAGNKMWQLQERPKI